MEKRDDDDDDDDDVSRGGSLAVEHSYWIRLRMFDCKS